MAIRSIIYYGDERLITPSKPIIEFNNALQTLVEDMFETMYALGGIGLAAPQLGINLEVAVIDVTEDKSQKWCLINPEIITKKGEVSMTEGCLSIPGAYGAVLRPEIIKFKAFDQYGTPFEASADDLLARCIQHEYDHLKGKLFIDYFSLVNKQRAIKQHRKALRQLKKQPTHTV